MSNIVAKQTKAVTYKRDKSTFEVAKKSVRRNKKRNEIREEMEAALGEIRTSVLGCTVEAIELVSNAINKGHYLNSACQLAGVDIQAYKRWLNRGEREYRQLVIDTEHGEEIDTRDMSVYVLCYLRTRHASAHMEGEHIARIDKASKEGSHQASTWFLERRFNDRWGRKVVENSTVNANINHKTQHHIIVVPEQAGSVDEWNKEKEMTIDGKMNVILDSKGIEVEDDNGLSEIT